VRIFSILCFALLLVACSGDPHDTRIPADISKWSTTVRPALQKLTPDEQALFAQYVRRHSTGAAAAGSTGDQADPIPEDITIGKAIAAQRSYLAQGQAKRSDEMTPQDKTGKQRSGQDK
jgi:hypothetical protein